MRDLPPRFWQLIHVVGGWHSSPGVRDELLLQLLDTTEATHPCLPLRSDNLYMQHEAIRQKSISHLGQMPPQR